MRRNRLTESEQSNAEVAVAILNKDKEHFRWCEEEPSEEDPWDDVDVDLDTACGSSVESLTPEELERRDYVDEIDEVSLWIRVYGADKVLESHEELRRLVDSWIDARYLLDQWEHRRELEEFLGRRSVSLQPDWQDFRDGRVRSNVLDLPNHASAEDHARWIFFLLVTGFYCRRIRRCKRCGKYYLQRRAGALYCSVKCSRHSSALAATKRAREADRDEKIRVLADEAGKLLGRVWQNKAECRRELLRKARRRNPAITSKFLTKHADEIPRPRLRKEER